MEPADPPIPSDQLPATAPGRLRVRAGTEADQAAIQRFNARLREGGVQYQLPVAFRVPGEFRQTTHGLPTYREMLVADDGAEIRAGLLLYRGGLWEAGQERPFCWVQLPVSEGLVDNRYSMAIVMLMRAVITREPRPMSLGIGSLDEAYARLLDRLGWRHAKVPFVFHPVRLREVRRRLPALQARRWPRAGARAVALVGVDRAVGTLLELARQRRRHLLRECVVQSESRFGGWADEVYHSARGDYGAAVARDAASLNVRYPPDDPRYIRLRVRRQSTGAELGWILVIHGQLQHSRYFGDLHVGTLVDGFGRRADVPRLVQAGTDYLADANVDLIVANWSHAAWLNAARRCGFLPGPSNYFLFVSPKGSSILTPSCPLSEVHMTRGDNDGPGHLLPPL
jgi:hypothetical protein